MGSLLSSAAVIVADENWPVEGISNAGTDVLTKISKKAVVWNRWPILAAELARIAVEAFATPTR